MKRLSAMIALAVLIGTFTVKAQGITVQDERQFNLQVYNMLDTYERTSGMFDALEQAEFTGLFTSPQTLVFNDLMGLDVGQATNATSETMRRYGLGNDVTVSEYVKALSSNVKGIRVALKNIRKGTIADNGDAWTMAVTMQKSISYSKCGVLLSGNEYYGADYDLTVHFVKNKQTGVCRISGITGSITSDADPFPRDYVVLQKTSDRDTLVTINGKPLRFNSYEQTFLPSSYNLMYDDDDVVLKVVDLDTECRLKSLKFSPKRFRVKPRVEISLGDFYKLEGINNSAVDTKSSEMNFGLDLGFAFPVGASVKLGLFAGAALSTSKLDFSIAALNYSYFASARADLDSDTYTRYYELSNVAQTLKSTDLVVPFYFDLDIYFGKRFSLALQAGAKMYVNMSNKLTSAMDVYAYGVYPQYSNLRLEEEYLNSFGRHTLGSNALTATTFAIKSCFDAFFGLEARAKLVGPLWLSVGLNYQMGLTKCFENNGTSVNTGSSVAEDNALVSYALSTGELVQPLVNQASSLKHNALKLSAGLIFKF